MGKTFATLANVAFAMSTARGFHTQCVLVFKVHWMMKWSSSAVFMAPSGREYL